jgi:predicted TIM-barrel fold metal-dependent hydrolase
VTVDVNVSLFRWPTRRLPLDDTAAFVRLLKAKGATQAWAGSFEGLLHRDVAGVNERLAEECRRFGDGLLLPFGVVDLQLPDWERDVERCADVHHMAGIRLHPNYHAYGLDDPRFEQLLSLAEAKDLIVQIAVRMEDPRTQHRLLRVPDVDVQPLQAVAARHPKARLVLLNALLSSGGELQSSLAQAGQVYFDIATLEGVGGLTRLLKFLPADRVLFGSHAPFFVWDSAALKLKESELPEPVLEQIRQRNAARLLTSAKP